MIEEFKDKKDFFYSSFYFIEFDMFFLIVKILIYFYYFKIIK